MILSQEDVNSESIMNAIAGAKGETTTESMAELYAQPVVEELAETEAEGEVSAHDSISVTTEIQEPRQEGTSLAHTEEEVVEAAQTETTEAVEIESEE